MNERVAKPSFFVYNYFCVRLLYGQRETKTNRKKLRVTC